MSIVVSLLFGLVKRCSSCASGSRVFFGERDDEVCVGTTISGPFAGTLVERLGRDELASAIVHQV